ncbi:glucose dehydrogenase [FAD, quinone]-like [Melanaphis sacchari]|uniref:Glucose dehydrogenase acceptor n=1 Tax=Melanaphis sacchari TaxID=742174 RepID=A0A2H8TVB6_9HEMI|nr:glucose dehydrogenase [FAD, quinone]-like [Melanaphis sacchari]
MNVGVILLGSILLIASPCFSINVFQYLGQAYRKNLIQFREDIQFGNKKILDEYDFIIVGAGAAGATIARRLAEVSEWNILLLEAGGEESLITSLPAIAHYLQFTNYNWAYHTEKELHSCRGLINKTCPWPAGKGLGGSTIINNNMYTRGNVRDFDRWAEAGNPGWSYNDVLPYFLKNENINIPELKKSPYHGVEGPLPISYAGFNSKLVNAFLESASEVGMSVGDYNAPGSHVVFSRIQSTTSNGRRITSARAYLHDNLKNLHIVEFGYVTKILIDNRTKVAYGVEFVKNKKKRKVLAKKEVIISAGTFNSAKLLMLSGIGPKEHLNSLNINTVSDLRVGDNLQEHPAYAGLAFLINETISFVPDRVYRDLIGEAFKILEKKSWMTTLPPEGVGYVKTKYNKDIGDIPDIEYIFIPGSLAGEAGLGGTMGRRSMGIPDKLFYETYNSILTHDSWTIWVMLMYPESRGQVRLRSANPFDKPVINGNFFTEPLDLKRIVEGIKMTIELSKTKAFQKYGSKLHTTPLLGCRHLEFGSDPYWECCVETMTMQMHHQSGTCKMGPEWDRNAVVNSQLKVYGVNRLRVIDASIMPTITGAHTVAPTYMIGEKGADLVKSTWLNKIQTDL